MSGGGGKETDARLYLIYRLKAVLHISPDNRVLKTTYDLGRISCFLINYNRAAGDCQEHARRGATSPYGDRLP